MKLNCSLINFYRAVFDEKRTVDVDVWHHCSDKDQWTLNVAGELDKDNKYQNTKIAVGALHEVCDSTVF